MRRFSAALVAALVLAGCSGGKGTDTATGDVTLLVADTLAGGKLELQGAYLRGTAGWAQALGNGTAFTFEGQGDNESASGSVAAGVYDRLRLLFSNVESGGRKAALTESGIEVAVNLTVAKRGNTTIALAFGWADAFFQSEKGLAFTPVLTRLVVTVDGTETLRLEAGDISTGSGKPPVARMRIFDSTGLEAFGSTFVADSPPADKPVVANAGNITLTATQSEALQPGASIKRYSWDITGDANATRLGGNTARWVSPVSGGKFTVRLTVEDSEGNTDSQTVSLALKPGLATKTFNFTGTAQGYGEGSAEDHDFEIDNATYDGRPAQLTHIRVVLQPGSATLPAGDLNLALLAEGTQLQAATGQGSQHTIDRDVSGPAGTWTARVTPNPAVGASYTVTVTVTWKGVNPGMEAFLADYEDGHSHEH